MSNLWVVGLFLSCAQEKAPAKNVVLTSTKHVAPSPDDFKNKSFFCCSEESVQSLLKSYISLQQALAGDDEEGSPRLARVDREARAFGLAFAFGGGQNRKCSSRFFNPSSAGRAGSTAGGRDPQPQS